MRNEGVGAPGQFAPATRTGQLLGGVAGTFAIVVVFYALGALLVVKVFDAEVGRAFFSPPAGVTVAAALLARRSRWPGLIAAIVVGESVVDRFTGAAVGAVGGYSLAAVVEPLVGASLVLAWCRGTPDLRDRRALVAFVLGAVLIGPSFGAIIGGTVHHLHEQGGWADSIAQWWISDALGVLVVATPILLWTKQSSVVRDRPWETAAVVVVTAGSAASVFLSGIPPTILTVPFLAWAALRLDMLGAALAGGALAFVAGFMAAHGHRAVPSPPYLSPSAQLMVSQLFVAVVISVALLVAQEAAARIEAVQARESERRERIQLQGLSQLAQQLSAALTSEDIGSALRNHVLAEAGAQGVALGLLDREGRHLEWVAAPGYPQQVQDEFNARSSLDAPLLATDVVRSGRPVMIRTRSEYARRYGASVRWLRVSDTNSIAGWPLSGGIKPFGALMVIWAESQPFDAAQVAYLSAVTTLVSQALIRARIYADEHARAAVLQSALIPENLGEAAGLDICVAYEPSDAAEGLGGDWYDVFRLPDNRMYFAVGDVIGHGLPAVEDMAQLRTAGRALAHHGLGPAGLLTGLNVFTRDASQGKFATMAVAIFDFTSSELTYCSAGHPPPLLRRAATGEVRWLSDTSGAVLGPIADTNYVEGSLTILPNDVLVMYTNGLVERRGVDIESGMAGAAELIAGWTAESPLADDCTTLHETLAPPPRRDDVCVIAVRFCDIA